MVYLKEDTQEMQKIISKSKEKKHLPVIYRVSPKHWASQLFYFQTDSSLFSHIQPHHHHQHPAQPPKRTRKLERRRKEPGTRARRKQRRRLQPRSNLGDEQ
jgi:hypothetical protein